jgi:leucyl aminopeptidase
MALYSSSAVAFNAFSRATGTRKIVSNAARSLSLTAAYLVNTSPVAIASPSRGTFHNFSSVRGGSAAFSNSALRMAEDSSDKQPFTTWTFDEHCKEMEFSSVSSASMAVSTDTGSVDDTDLVIIGVYGLKKKEEEEDEEKDDEEANVPEPILSGLAKELDEKYSGALTDIMMEQYKEFQHGAKAGGVTPTLRLVSEGGKKAKKIILLGLGNEGKDIEDGFVGKIGSTIASKCDGEKKIKNCTVVLPSGFNLDDAPLKDLSTEFYASLYSDNRYRTKDKVKKMAEDLETVTIVSEGSVNISDATGALDIGKALATGIFMTKDIVNAPHNVLNSESLANVARKIAEDSNGTIKCTILGKEECEKRGMGAYLGVARGSETEPQFIHLTYTPKSGKVNKKVGIVGKGLLFDTGGYNIKTAMMELMKFDCGGSAAVLGAARAIGLLAPEGVEAHFIVAACENMINERAVVPSDVLTASNGKTIEIVNTDAEGRLTLADALVYADKEIGCESIIELSTLTGACMVSLGTKICGVWTDNDDLATELADVSKTTGDKSWRMPMEKEYNDQLKSKIADMTNCGTRYGGAITAALFLQNFVDKKKPFAHIDIAGPVWDDKVGATGFGAKLVSDWVSRQGESTEGK